jgi:hypothetical protein
VTDFPFHAETRISVLASPEALFGHLDDHLRLSAHMTRRNWMMGGSRMFIETDAGKGRTIGSVIRLHGRVLGIPLDLEEVVTDREPPLRKTWTTVKEPKLLVIGAYRMGFEITPEGTGCMLRVHLDYATPRAGISRLLGKVFGKVYARWCTDRMARDAKALEAV